MAKLLKFNADWSEEQQVELNDLLGLTEEQGDKLFVEEKSIALNADQAKAFERWLSDQDVAAAAVADNAPVAADTSTINASEPVRAHAIELVNLIADNPAIDTNFRKVIEATEQMKRGAIALCFMLRKAYGDKLDDFPVPGSQSWQEGKDGEEGFKPASNNPDRYRVKTKGKKSDVWVKFSFYDDYARNTPFGTEIVAALEAISNALSVYGDSGSFRKAGKPIEAFQSANGEVINFATMTQPQVKAAEKMWSQRLTAIASSIKTAIKVNAQLNRLQLELKDEIDVQIATNADGSIAATAYPINIINKRNVSEYKPFASSGLLALDVDKAVANGGSFDHLMATTGKGTDDSSGETVAEIKNVGKFDEYIAAVLNWLDRDTAEKELLTYLAAKDKQGKFLHDHLVMSLHKLVDALDSPNTKTEPRYRVLEEAELNVTTAAAVSK